jgi:hypothetical protein
MALSMIATPMRSLNTEDSGLRVSVIAWRIPASRLVAA